MDYQGFITTVRERADVSDAEAERVACATLKTLADRLTTGETEDLAERLPGELRRCLEPDEPGQRYHVDEFLRRVAERAGVDEPAAERDARAVFAALWAAVGPDEFADMRSELPKDFGPLLDRALVDAPPPEREQPPSAPILSFDEFVGRVAERLDVDRERARRATEAVLEALAGRISPGQVDDLERQLAPELRPALERGVARSGGRARQMTVEGFEAAVAELEDVPRGTAAEHARAVLATLREAVDEKEFADTKAQLPGEYRRLLSASRPDWQRPAGVRKPGSGFASPPPA
ncbi:MAG: hypothetical protein QOF29_1674 [bacterium]